VKDKVTIQTLKKHKQIGQKICMVTAYDATFARILDDGGADALLVGDSLGMVIQGQDSTLPVTMDQMVYHTQAVRRGAKRALVVADLPFGSYQASDEEAVKNAMRLISEGGAAAVKLEGGAAFEDVIRKMVRASVPVMGHIGLMPQSVNAMGGFVVQGRGDDAAEQILEDALAVERAGAFSVVLEGIPMELAEVISKRLTIPTIGIGAGIHCDGQVLVCYDLLGMNPDFKPKFVKHFADHYTGIREAAEGFFRDVRGRSFPADEHSFHAKKPIRLVGGESAPAEEKIGAIYGSPV